VFARTPLTRLKVLFLQTRLSVGKKFKTSAAATAPLNTRLGDAYTDFQGFATDFTFFKVTPHIVPKRTRRRMTIPMTNENKI
jgi:hypothetical protein